MILEMSRDARIKRIALERIAILIFDLKLIDFREERN